MPVEIFQLFYDGSVPSERPAFQSFPFIFPDHAHHFLSEFIFMFEYPVSPLLIHDLTEFSTVTDPKVNDLLL